MSGTERLTSPPAPGKQGRGKAARSKSAVERRHKKAHQGSANGGAKSEPFEASALLRGIKRLSLGDRVNASSFRKFGSWFVKLSLGSILLKSSENSITVNRQGKFLKIHVGNRKVVCNLS